MATEPKKKEPDIPPVQPDIHPDRGPDEIPPNQDIPVGEPPPTRF